MKKILKNSFSPWPDFSDEEAQIVKEVILSNKVNYWTGSECREFEKEFADWSEVNFAIALANGSLALELALKALGVGEGDEVIVTSRTFIASVSCIVLAGAKPVFADVDLNSQNITAETISNVLTNKTKAIIAVHLGGMPCDMDPIMDLAKENNLFVIEDCAQAHGALYKGRPVGSIGNIGTWSFCQDKIMTTAGEGGMVTTQDEALWKKMWSFKDHGKIFDAVYKRQHPPGFRWLHDSFGSNYRMMEVQGAIGRYQLKKMNDWTKIRQENSREIDEAALNHEVYRTQKVSTYFKHARYKHYLFVNQDKLKPGWSRDRLLDEINESGIPCFQGSCSEVYLEKAFEGTSFLPKSRLPNAKELGETSLMFLVHPTLSKEEISLTAKVVSEVGKEALNR